MQRRLSLISFILMVVTGISSARQLHKSIVLTEVLSLGQKAGFIKVGELTCDSKQNVFVTDSYQYSIRKFNGHGSFQKEFGRHGNHQGQFNGFPFKIDCMADTLAIVALGSSRVQFFTPGFLSAGEISVAGPIVDIVYDTYGRIYTNIIPLSHKREDVLLLYDKTGKIVSNVALAEARGEPAFDMIHLSVDSKNNLVTAYRFINKIAIYDQNQRLISQYSVDGLPAESPAKKSEHPELGSLPEGEIFRDIAVDNRGNVFLLAGDYSKKPDKEVYVTDYRGKLITIFALPEKTGILHFDREGFLYTREQERTVVKKYKLTYRNF